MHNQACCDICPAPSDTAAGELVPDRKTAPAAIKWLLADKTPSVAVNAPAVKLICLPQAGMGAWVYQSWSEHLAPHIQVMQCDNAHGAAAVTWALIWGQGCVETGQTAKL